MGPHRFLSTKSHKEFDCVNQRVRLLASSEHSQHMGTGVQNAVAVAQGSGLPIEPGSINEALWNVACGKTGEGTDYSSGAFSMGMPARYMCPLATDRGRSLSQNSPIFRPSFVPSRLPL